MARDYKNTARTGKKPGRPRHKNAGNTGLWRWMLATVLVIGFAVFLTYLRSNKAKQPSPETTTPLVASGKPIGDQKPAVDAEKKSKKTEPAQPHFEFYIALPKKEDVVPEHELSTRLREERLGKVKPGRYLIQAGSSKTSHDADRLKAELALMGIESKVEKIKVGTTEWHRVIIGPYTQMASVDAIKKRLKARGMDAIVLESAKKATAKP